MRKLKRFLLFLLPLVSIIICTSCSPQEKTAKESKFYIDFPEDSKKVDNFDSPYTKMYKNDDGTADFYIFYSPVFYLDSDGNYKPIDNTIVQTDKNTYENKNNSIKLKMPCDFSKNFSMHDIHNLKEKEIIFSFDKISHLTKGAVTDLTNIFGEDLSAVLYENNNIKIFSYFTNTGFRFEFHFLNNDKIKMNLPLDYEYININGVYTASINDENKFTINHLIKKVNNDIITSTAEMEDNSILVEGSADEIIEMSVDYYRKKSPDTTVYKGKNDSYLSNISFLEENMQSEYYVRNKLLWFIYPEEEDIERAEFMLYSFSENTSEINISSPFTQWSSSQMTWDNKVSDSETITSSIINKGINFIDVTKYYKECCKNADSYKENRGFLITNVKGNKLITGTGDNPTYCPGLKIKFKKIPSYTMVRTDLIRLD